jgi:ankyrin repeat protein
MKKRLKIIAAVISLLVIGLTATWSTWRRSFAEDQLRKAIETDDAGRVCRLIRWGAPHDKVEAVIPYENFFGPCPPDHCPNCYPKKITMKPLHWAAAKGYRDVAALLLEHGAPVDEKIISDWTPLLFAVYLGRREMVELLLAHNACADEDERGTTPLAFAVYRRDIDLVVLLLNKGAAVDREYDKPLHWAASKGNSEIALLLLEKGADIGSRDLSGSTPLHKAADSTSTESEILVKRFLESGADPNAKDDHGRTPLYIAARGNKCALAEILLSKGADVNAVDKGGWNPLHVLMAMAMYNPDNLAYKPEALAELLLKHGADAEMKDKYGRTPIDEWPKLADIVMKVNAGKANNSRLPAPSPFPVNP